MIPIKSIQKFKCDFCNKKSTKKVMERHEIICYKNPNRKCRSCDGSGYTNNEFNEKVLPCIDCLMANRAQDKSTEQAPCPCCKTMTTWSKKYEFYCGCQGLAGNEDDHDGY